MRKLLISNKRKNLSLEELKALAKKFVADRNWQQYHNPKDVALDISIEANELLELFVWKSVEEFKQKYKTDKKFKTDVQDEFADVFHAFLSFAVVMDIDIQDVFLKKLEKTAQKYPPEKVMGQNKKYTEL